MLVLRKPQVDVIGRVPYASYEAALVRHFRRYYPFESEQAGEQQVRKLIRYGVARAAVHSYFAQRDVALYVNLMLMLGADFDRDPMYPWALEQLNDVSVENPFRRIQRVFRSATEYLGKTAGAGNANLFAALERVVETPLEDAPASMGLRFETEMSRLLERWFPEKRAALGSAVTTDFLRATFDLAWEDGLRTPQGRAVYTGIAFLLGSRASRDPMHPWIARILTDPSLASESERVAALYRGAMEYARLILAQR